MSLKVYTMGDMKRVQIHTKAKLTGNKFRRVNHLVMAICLVETALLTTMSEAYSPQCSQDLRYTSRDHLLDTYVVVPHQT